MKPLVFAALFLLSCAASAQVLPDQKLKEGLWMERTSTLIHPSNQSTDTRTSACHGTQMDFLAQQKQTREMDQHGCTIRSDATVQGVRIVDESCSIPGGTVHVHAVVTSADDEHVHTVGEVSYDGAVPGTTGETTTSDLIYQGPCPAGVHPGDQLENLSNGKSIIVPASNGAGDVARVSAQGVRVIATPQAVRGTASPPMAMTAAQTRQAPGLTQRPPAPTITSGPALTNADIISLAAAGLDDTVILAKINSAPSTGFDTSIDGLKALKAGGVSNAVIQIIVTKGNAAEVQAAAHSDDPNVMHQPGVYVQIAGRDGQVHLVELEHTHAIGSNTSGNSLIMAYGLGKRHIRESLNNPTSPVRLEDRNPSFYIYIPQDTESFGGNAMSARDFELVKLRVKSKIREVETSSLSNSGMGNTGLEEKSRVNTVPQKIKAGIYLVKVASPLKPGEYAFQHELEGVFYDFTITESR